MKPSEITTKNWRLNLFDKKEYTKLKILNHMAEFNSKDPQYLNDIKVIF